MVGEPIKPGTFWYWLAGLLVIAGLAAAVVLGTRGVASFSRVVTGLQRVPIPGSAQVPLTEGGHVVYYEQRGTTAVPEFGLLVTPSSGGAPVEVRPYAGQLRYHSNGVSGTAVYTFDVVTPGLHDIRASGADGSGSIAVGPSISRGVFGLVGGILGAFGLVGATFVIAVVIVVVVAVLRNRAQKAAAPAV